MKGLPLFIAGRYLFARKSHNVINIISAISCIGMAVGTAALVLILSVYNGLDSVVRASIDVTAPEILASPARGKSFACSDSTLQELRGVPGVVSVQPTVEDNVFADYDGIQTVAYLKGVDDSYEQDTGLGKYITEGSFTLRKGSLGMAVAGRALASSLRMSPRFVAGVDLYYPRTEGEISIQQAASSVNRLRLFPSGTLSVNQEVDESVIFAPLDRVRELLQVEEGEFSRIEIRLDGERPFRQVRRDVEEILGDGIRTSSREEQNETLYRMLRGEKAMIFLILVFVIIVIAFNIFGSLSMLIVEKDEDIGTLRAMGADDRMIRRIFTFEGWLISLLGMAAGIAVGTALALVQQYAGIVKMPGNFIVSSYPVIVEWTDLVLCAACVGAIGYLIAFLPVRRRFGRGK